jgi:hypothetical protein
LPLLAFRKDINDYYREQNYLVRITPQVFLLERLLNKKVHETNKKIYIDDSIDTPGFYFSRSGDPNMCYFVNGGYFSFIVRFGFDNDFLVYVPEYYMYNENALNKIRYYLEKYKLISTSYRIIFYE